MDIWKILLGKASKGDPSGKTRIGPAQLPDNLNKKIIISQNDDSLSLFAPSDVDHDLQREEQDALWKVMFVVNDTELVTGPHWGHFVRADWGVQLWWTIWP